MPDTAFAHFQEDIGRARAIVTHATPLASGTAAEEVLRSDLLRAAWMFAVGALDAYFCDAYTDLVAATVNSKSRHPPMALPEFFNEIKFPIRSILEEYANPNWRWRMAARKMMERETVLSLESIRKLFNRFFRNGQKFFREVLAAWLVHPDAKRRLFGISANRFNRLSAADRTAALDGAWDRLQDRFDAIFQRRHDCIHNCDRPRVSPQPLKAAEIVSNVVEDIDFLVQRSNAHIDSEFRQFLIDCGCPAAIVVQAGY